MKSDNRTYRDLREHVEALAKDDLLITIDEPIDKDSEMHPLVRWQFRGGIEEADRKAFLFTNITDGKGRQYDIPVVVGAVAATPAIYATGMGVPVEEIGGKWSAAMSAPIAPREVDDAPCQEMIITGEDLLGEGNGLDALPIPVSTPGFDSAPTLSATNCVTRDPETGVLRGGSEPRKDGCAVGY